MAAWIRALRCISFLGTAVVAGCSGGEPTKPPSLNVPGMTPDVYYSAPDPMTGGRAIWRVGLDSMNVTQITSSSSGNPFDQTSPAVNMAGDTILFTQYPANNFTVPPDVWGANADGTNPHAVEDDAAENQLPGFAATGDAYAWSKDGDIWYREPGSAAVQLTMGPENDYDVCFGKVMGMDVIFFSRHDPTNTTSDIYWIPVTGGAPTAVAADPNVSEDHPSYSIANDKIVFEQGADDLAQDDIWVMDPDGTNRVQVTSDTGDDDDPVWSPDGGWLVWERTLPSGQHSVVKLRWPVQPGAIPLAISPLGVDAREPTMSLQ